jgi:ketosteroid isomerase-like protein
MKNLLLLFIALAMVSCNQQAEKIRANNGSISSVNVDSLNAIFLAGWNNKDSAAIMKTIGEDAVVMNDSLIHAGRESIAKNWISGGVKVLSNIKTNSSIQKGDKNLAYDAGTYSLDLTPPGGPVLKEKGNYTLVWTKQDNSDWLLTLVHIEDVTRLPDIK